MTKFAVSQAACVSFLGMFGAHESARFSVSADQMTKYTTSTSNSDIRTYGGPALNPENFSLTEWVGNIGNDLVAVDRNGYPLNYIITTATLPELSEGLALEVAQPVGTAVATYYRHITYRGYTSLDAPNFSQFSHVLLTNLRFAGVYQSCVSQGK